MKIVYSSGRKKGKINLFKKWINRLPIHLYDFIYQLFFLLIIRYNKMKDSIN